MRMGAKEIKRVSETGKMRPSRLELLTYGLGNRRSIQLSYGRLDS